MNISNTHSYLELADGLLANMNSTSSLLWYCLHETNVGALMWISSSTICFIPSASAARKAGVSLCIKLPYHCLKLILVRMQVWVDPYQRGGHLAVCVHVCSILEDKRSKCMFILYAYAYHGKHAIGTSHVVKTYHFQAATRTAPNPI